MNTQQKLELIEKRVIELIEENKKLKEEVRQLKEK